MALTKDLGACSGATNFIFLENDLLLKDAKDAAGTGGTGGTPPDSLLPDEQTLRTCIGRGEAADWFCEPEQGYRAARLKTGTAAPKGHCLVPLRNFFWTSRGCGTTANAPAELSALGCLAARAHGLAMLRQTYRYCPTCGSPLTDDAQFTAARCTGCGTLLFPRIEPAVIVLVTRRTQGREQVLLVKSKTVSHKTFAYSCVAGFVEHGESAEQCARREVLEETGITVQNVRYAGSQPWPFPDQLMLAFTAEYAGGDIQIQQSEIEEAAWFYRDELPSVPLPGSVAYNLLNGLFPGAPA